MSINRIFLYIFSAELLSVLAFLFPELRIPAFMGLFLLALFCSLKDLKFGLYFVFAELFIGSLGYLFWLDAGDFRVSGRIAIWAAFMAAWLFKAAVKLLKEKKNPFLPETNNKFFNSIIFYFFLLIFFAAWGAINGFLNNNGLKNIFFDANGWIFLIIIFPVIYILDNEKDLRSFADNLKAVFTASLIWLSAKAFVVLYLFSHNFPKITPFAYRWIRDTRVGEITRMDSGFVRVFFQSFIYLLAGFFVFFLLFFFYKYIKQNKERHIKYLSASVIFLSALIFSFSRSNWIGLGFGFLAAAFIVWQNYRAPKTLKFIYSFFIAGLLGFLLVSIIVYLPFSSSQIKEDAASLIKDRASSLSDEAGVSSRWNLLPVLWGEIKISPVLGMGFGKTLTYISNDPRVRESSENGEYTTSAFEWGWLSIWFKLGFFGLAAYLLLIYKIIEKSRLAVKKEALANEDNIFISGIIIGILCLVMINFFSPYFDHPLGIGLLLFAAILIESRSRLAFPLAKP